MSSLDPYVPSADAPWDSHRASHLLRRCGIKADPVRVREIIVQNPLDVVDAIVDDALALPLPPAPPIASNPPPPPDAPREEINAYTALNVEAARLLRSDWIGRLFDDGLREKMTLLWSNHFVTQLRIYFYAAYAHQYLEVLRTHALGNFRDFVFDIGTNPAMVNYLNGSLNQKGHPNENYARELLELFTVGLDQYTQQDITELARALTGWSDVPSELRVVFDPARFDDGEKTIFGQTGSYDYSSSVDLIFEQRSEAIARFVCTKIYSHLVFAHPDEAVVQEMADLLIAEDFEIAPVVRALLKSAHFFDEAFVRGAIRQPLELFGAIAELVMPDGSDASAEALRSEILDMGESVLRVWGQVPLDPPNVAGWKGDRAWITSGTLVDRWNFSLLLLRRFDINMGKLFNWISDLESASVLAWELAEHLLGPQDPESAGELTDLLLAGTPDYEWSISSEAAADRIKSYIMMLVQRPSFQLA